MKKANLKIRKASKLHDVPLWRVARLLGVSYDTLVRRLRYELPEDEQDRIVTMIETYAQKQENS